MLVHSARKGNAQSMRPHSNSEAPLAGCAPSRRCSRSSMRLPTLHAAEGLTVDCIWRVVSSPVLPALLVTAFFWSSRLASEAGLKAQAWRPITGTTLLVWTGLWCLMSVNDYLSHGARNNWTKDTTWKWTKEVVVVTGGEY